MAHGTKQDWTPGSIVRVGFLKLMVLRKENERDSKYDPYGYILSNLTGTKNYRFTPYNGLESL